MKHTKNLYRDVNPKLTEQGKKLCYTFRVPPALAEMHKREELREYIEDEIHDLVLQKESLRKWFF